MNKKNRAFFDGMTLISSIFYSKRFVPTHSNLFNYIIDENIKNNTKTIEERISEDIRSDFNVTAQDMWNAIEQLNLQ